MLAHRRIIFVKPDFLSCGMWVPFSRREMAVWEVSVGGGDLLLSESKLEASLAQVGGDRIGLTKLADPRVFVAGTAVRAASAGTARSRPPSGLPEGDCRVSSQARTYQRR
jgi:hypothetical protein